MAHGRAGSEAGTACRAPALAPRGLGARLGKATQSPHTPSLQTQRLGAHRAPCVTAGLAARPGRSRRDRAMDEQAA